MYYKNRNDAARNRQPHEATVSYTGHADIERGRPCAMDDGAITGHVTPCSCGGKLVTRWQNVLAVRASMLVA